MLWLIGWLFTVGVIIMDEDEDLKGIGKPKAYFISIILWPVILGGRFMEMLQEIVNKKGE